MSGFSIAGHWRRESITGPGMEDRTTRVHWLQAEVGFCDIRIPSTRPDLGGATALADLGAEALLELMNGFGFAGQARLKGARCTWHRQIAFHGTPPGAAPDIGILRPGPGGRMIEDGAEGAYREVWGMQGTGPYDHAVWQDGSRACLITWGECDFLLAIGRIDAPGSLSLRQALEGGARPETELADFFDAEYSYGIWQDAAGVVSLSTNPLREGQAILARGDLVAGPLRLKRADFFGVERDEVWHREAVR
ncbi:hypothetical protein [Pseudooceanicola algae]|uniref:Uncharacterized protein n=1 Tax=Pseudooceanicola algae TaxID=1537215 RepID=A0A418SGA4_9RHOB|nr:hypothetical protein [Pseudooceanicola algae]QPM91675.1 hypothetical protein PSAL_029300 [Pseudooceanicola algae]